MLLLSNVAAALVLTAGDTVLPPQAIDYRVHITAGAADVEVTQRFPEVPSEARWQFPLPPEAAADRIAVDCGAGMVAGSVQPWETTDTAPDGAFGLALPSECVGEEATITLHYIAPLHTLAGRTTLVLPLTDGPQADVWVTLGSDPHRVVWSDSHDIDLSGDTVSVHTPDVGEDFALSWTTGGPPRLSAVTHQPPSGVGFVGLTIEPGPLTADSPVLPRELIVVVDRSYVMQRESLALGAVAAMLDGMRPEDTFNLVRFSMRAEALQETSQPVGPESQAIAADFLTERTGAGARLEAGLETALRLPTDPERLRVVVLISGSTQGDPHAIRGVLDEALGEARLFPVALDNTSPDLLETLAMLGRGEVIRAASGTSERAFIEAIQDRIAAPAATDLTIRWGMPMRNVLPRHLPDLWYGTPLHVVGDTVASSETRSAPLSEVVVTGQAADSALSLTGSIPRGPPDHTALSTMWATAQIAMLRRFPGSLTPERLAFVIRGLGIRHQVITPYTALVLQTDPPQRIDVGGVWPGPALPRHSPGPGEGRLQLQGEPTVQGALSSERIRAAMQKRLPALARCVARSDVEGRLTLAITIGPSGWVTDVSLSSASLAHVELEACMTSALASMGFGPLVGGGTVILRYPLVLAASI